MYNHPGWARARGGKTIEKLQRRQMRSTFFRSEDADELEVEWKVSLLSLPLVFLFALVSQWLWVFGFLCWYFFSIPIHELGHSLAAWLGGRFAIPLGALIPMAGVSIIFETRSLWLFLVLCGGLSFLALSLWRQGCYFFASISALLITLALILTWGVSEQTSQMIVTYGGIAGEFLLSTFLVISFHYEMPPRFRWDFFRFPFLLAGGSAFLSVSMLWWKISRGRADLPTGSFLDGKGDSNGDIQRLISAHGWSQAELIAHFVKLGRIGAGIMIAHYLYFLWKARLKRSERARLV